MQAVTIIIRNLTAFLVESIIKIGIPFLKILRRESEVGWVKFKRYAKRQAVLQRRAMREKKALNEANRLQKNEDDKRRAIQEVANLKRARNTRHQKLIDIFSDDYNTFEHDLGDTFKFATPEQVLGTIREAFSDLNGHALNLDNNEKEVLRVFKTGISHAVARPVSDIPEKEIHILKLLSYLNTLELVSDQFIDTVQLSIAYNGGSSSLYATYSGSLTSKSDIAIRLLLEWWLTKHLKKPQLMINESITVIGRIRKDIHDDNLLEATSLSKTISDQELLGIIDNGLDNGKSWATSDSF